VHEKIRRRPSVAGKARRSTGRANPHQRSGEVERIVHSAEEQPFAKQRDGAAQGENAGKEPDTIQVLVRETKKQSADKEKIKKIQQQDEMKKFELGLMKDRMQSEILEYLHLIRLAPAKQERL